MRDRGKGRERGGGGEREEEEKALGAECFKYIHGDQKAAGMSREQGRSAAG